MEFRWLRRSGNQMEACEASVRALMCSDGGLGDWCFKGTRDWLFGDRHVIAWWLGMGSGYGVVLWPVKVLPEVSVLKVSAMGSRCGVTMRDELWVIDLLFSLIFGGVEREGR